MVYSLTFCRAIVRWYWDVALLMARPQCQRPQGLTRRLRGQHFSQIELWSWEWPQTGFVGRPFIGVRKYKKLFILSHFSDPGARKNKAYLLVT